jgi:hypothetical protein
MALNEVLAEAFSADYPVNAAVVSGMFVVLGGTTGAVEGAHTGIVGVAETSAKLGDDGLYYSTLRHIGTYIGTTALAVSVGNAMYIAGGLTYGAALTTVATANHFVGSATRAKGATAGNVFVRVNN